MSTLKNTETFQPSKESQILCKYRNGIWWWLETGQYSEILSFLVFISRWIICKVQSCHSVPLSSILLSIMLLVALGMKGIPRWWWRCWLTWTFVRPNQRYGLETFSANFSLHVHTLVVVVYLLLSWLPGRPVTVSVEHYVLGWNTIIHSII